MAAAPSFAYADGTPSTTVSPATTASCGPGARVGKVVQYYRMKRVEGGYRRSTLYCGNNSYGYRHIVARGHISQYFGGWSNFSFSIAQTLKTPAAITYKQSNDTYTHRAPIDQCFYSEGLITKWTFYVVTTAYAATIVTAYGRRGATVQGYC
jgi:hypothetical protein